MSWRQRQPTVYWTGCSTGVASRLREVVILIIWHLWGHCTPCLPVQERHSQTGVSPTGNHQDRGLKHMSGEAERTEFVNLEQRWLRRDLSALFCYPTGGQEKTEPDLSQRCTRIRQEARDTSYSIGNSDQTSWENTVFVVLYTLPVKDINLQECTHYILIQLKLVKRETLRSRTLKITLSFLSLPSREADLRNFLKSSQNIFSN